MTIRTRIEKLEKAEPSQGDDKITTVLWRTVLKQADGIWTEETHGVHILAGPFGDGMSLYRSDNESSESLHQRAAAEMLRIHGKIDYDWPKP